MANIADIADIQVDPDVDQTSSSDYDSIRSDLTSLTESIYSYIYENGRTYHAYRSGSYFLPNDEREQDSMFYIMFSALSTVATCVKRNSSIHKEFLTLAQGQAFGPLRITVGDQFPGAEVIGVDLSPIQPGWVPPNVRFVIEDMNQSDWSFAEGSFDLIHIRCLAGCLDDWTAFLRRCYEYGHTKK
ncbi:unnamed protein product [Penicillium pancosmium]